MVSLACLATACFAVGGPSRRRALEPTDATVSETRRRVLEPTDATVSVATEKPANCSRLAGDDANRFCNSDEACAGASCAYRTQPQAAPNVDAIRSTSALANFTTSYNYTYANGEVETLFLYGFEPTDRASQYPVYMHGGGAGDRFLMDAADRLTGRIPTVGELPELVFAREMASRGFVAVVMEMPRATNTTLMCDGDWGSMINVTRRVFGYGGAGDTQETALATLCRRSTADCSRGIALNGLSQGGLLSALAPGVAVGITAELRWSTGVYMAGGWSCCGIFSRNSSCCRPGSPVGGSALPCMHDQQTSTQLTGSRRRIISAFLDPEYGDLACPSPEEGGTFEGCILHAGSTDSAVNQTWLQSHRRCSAAQGNCIAPDGSGYYILTPDEIEGNNNSYYQQHNFHMRTASSVANLPPQQTRGYYINPTFLHSTAPWGMHPSFDWLAITATTPIAERASPTPRRPSRAPPGHATPLAEPLQVAASERPPAVAIFCGGVLRSLLSYPVVSTYQERLVQPLERAGYAVDAFVVVVTGTTCNASILGHDCMEDNHDNEVVTNHTEELRAAVWRAYRPVRFELLPERDVALDFNPGCLPWNNASSPNIDGGSLRGRTSSRVRPYAPFAKRILQQWATIRFGYALIVEQEEARGAPYEWIVRTRTDVVFFDDLGALVARSRRDRVHMPRNGMSPSLSARCQNDLLFWCPRALCRPYFELLEVFESPHCRGASHELDEDVHALPSVYAEGHVPNGADGPPSEDYWLPFKAQAGQMCYEGCGDRDIHYEAEFWLAARYSHGQRCRSWNDTECCGLVEDHPFVAYATTQYHYVYGGRPAGMNLTVGGRGLDCLERMINQRNISSEHESNETEAWQTCMGNMGGGDSCPRSWQLCLNMSAKWSVSVNHSNFLGEPIFNQSNLNASEPIDS